MGSYKRIDSTFLGNGPYLGLGGKRCSVVFRRDPGTNAGIPSRGGQTPPRTVFSTRVCLQGKHRDVVESKCQKLDAVARRFSKRLPVSTGCGLVSSDRLRQPVAGKPGG